MVGESSLYKTLEVLQPHDHSCLIYESQKERRDAVIPFIKIGLKRGEKCIYIVDARTVRWVKNALKKEGVDIKAVEQAGQLVILHESETYTQEEPFDPDRMITFLIEETKKAVKEGYAALRVTSEMTWMLEGHPGSERIIEYEAKLNRDLFLKYPCLAICQYDRRKFDPEIMKGAMLTHPLVIRGGAVHHNFYYIPTEDFLTMNHAETEVQQWLNNVERETNNLVELQRCEERFKSLFQNNPIPIFIWQRKGSDFVFIDYNLAADLMTKGSARNFIGRRAKTLYGKRKFILQDMERCFAGETVIRREVISRHFAPGRYLSVTYAFITSDLVAVQIEDLTEKKISGEEAIRRSITEERPLESEASYRSLIESSLDAVLLTVPDGSILAANDAACRMFGYSEEELRRIGRNGIVDRTDPRLVVALKERARIGKGITELTFIRRDGTKFPGEVLSSIFRIEDGRLRTSMVIRDITKRKRAEKEIEDSERRFRELFDNMSSGVAVYIPQNNGEDFIFADMNKAGERIDRVRRDEVIGRSVLEAFPSIREMGLFDVLRKVWKTGRPQHHPVSFYKDNRLTGWFENYVYKLPTGEVIAVYDDMTERRMMEEALSASEEKYRNLVENISDAVYEIDHQGTVKYVSPIIRDILGYDPADIIGKSFIEFVHEEDRDRLVERFSELQYGVEYPTEYRYISKSGDARWVRTRTRPVIKDSRFIGAHGTLIDITDQKKAEEKIKHSLDQMAALAARLQSVREEERTDIARTIHDEMGQALTAIRMDVSLIMRRITKKKDITQDDILSRLQLVCDLTDSTVKEMRAIVTRLRPGILDDLGLAAAVEWQAQDFTKRTGIQCNFVSLDVEVILDNKRATALFRIFQESLTNVLRHAGASRIDITLHTIGNMIVLEVTDNGRGITKDEIDGKQSFGLLGIRERVLSFKGEVEITGRQGRGTTVKVTMPLSEA